MRLKLSLIFISVFLALSLLTMMTSSVTVSAQTDPTPIPVLPEETEDSAAPSAPGIAPPVVVQPVIATTEEPEATAEPSVDTPSEITVNTAPVCPAAVQDAFTATEILCSDVGSGEACIGNGSVESDFGADVSSAFAQANDRVRLNSLDQLTITSGNAWSVVRAQIELATTDGGDIATGTMFAYGNVTLVDTGRIAGAGAQNGTVIAQRGMNVRRTPENSGVAVWQLQAGEQVNVTGISADDEWIRIIIPNEFAGTGWVYAPYIQVDGGTETLATVDVNSPQPDLAPPEFAPGQSFELLSGDTPEDCGEDVPDSGLLLQSPSGTPDAIRIEINGVEIQVNGTVFIQAQAERSLQVSVLEGEATAIADDATVSATVDNRISVPLDSNLNPSGAPQSETFNSEDLVAVPTRLLPRQIILGLAPIDVELAAEETSDDAEEEDSNTGFGTPAPSPVPEECRLTAPDEVRNIRGGPSTEFPVVGVLQANEDIVGVGQALGQLNLTWFQTATGGWLRIDTITPSASCANLPMVEAPPLPEPTSTPSAEETAETPTNDGEASLSSSVLPALACDGTAITGSASSDGAALFVEIGGTWTVAAGTSVTFTTQGGMLRPELGDLIQLIAEDDSVIAGSGEGRSLTVDFANDATFTARFSAANGDTVVMAASCN